MKILHLSTYDEVGGAARAASRLHRGLLESGMDSWMAVRRKAGDSYRVVSSGDNGKLSKAAAMIRPSMDALPLSLHAGRQHTPWNVAWLPSGMGEKINTMSPDVVHAHWVCQGFLSLHNLRRIRSPLIWTLHDSWPFTGGCHVVGGCTSFRMGCGQCPQLGSARRHDLSSLGWHRKRRLYENKRVTFVAPSRWMAEQAKSSSLLADVEIEIIPNGLDTSTFRPIDKRIAREQLRLPLDKKIILFGAIGATSDSNKGFDKLKSALRQLHYSPIRDEIELAIFGISEPADKPELGFNTTYLGRFHDEVSLASVYSAADIMCVPSIQESFGQVATEAMSCGTPVVAFGSTGLLDVVQHGITGYLASPYDESDLARGIELLLTDSSRLISMSHASRERVLANFSVSTISSLHLSLYEKLITAR